MNSTTAEYIAVTPRTPSMSSSTSNRSTLRRSSERAPQVGSTASAAGSTTPSSSNMSSSTSNRSTLRRPSGRASQAGSTASVAGSATSNAFTKRCTYHWMKVISDQGYRFSPTEHVTGCTNPRCMFSHDRQRLTEETIAFNAFMSRDWRVINFLPVFEAIRESITGNSGFGELDRQYSRTVRRSLGDDLSTIFTNFDAFESVMLFWANHAQTPVDEELLRRYYVSMSIMRRLINSSRMCSTVSSFLYNVHRCVYVRGCDICLDGDNCSRGAHAPHERLNLRNLWDGATGKTAEAVTTRRTELEAEIAELRRSYPGVEVFRERADFDAWNRANSERRESKGFDPKISAFHRLHRLKKELFECTTMVEPTTRGLVSLVERTSRKARDDSKKSRRNVRMVSLCDAKPGNLVHEWVDPTSLALTKHGPSVESLPVEENLLLPPVVDPEIRKQERAHQQALAELAKEHAEDFADFVPLETFMEQPRMYREWARLVRTLGITVSMEKFMTNPSQYFDYYHSSAHRTMSFEDFKAQSDEGWRIAKTTAKKVEVVSSLAPVIVSAPAPAPEPAKTSDPKVWTLKVERPRSGTFVYLSGLVKRCKKSHDLLDLFKVKGLKMQGVKQLVVGTDADNTVVELVPEGQLIFQFHTSVTAEAVSKYVEQIFNADDDDSSSVDSESSSDSSSDDDDDDTPVSSENRFRTIQEELESRLDEVMAETDDDYDDGRVVINSGVKCLMITGIPYLDSEYLEEQRQKLTRKLGVSCIMKVDVTAQKATFRIPLRKAVEHDLVIRLVEYLRDVMNIEAEEGDIVYTRADRPKVETKKHKKRN